MDDQQGRQADQEAVRRYVDAGLAEIKGHMPETYRAIQAKAANIGNRAYAFVRRGLAGQPNAFYAMENGRVVGTPFDLPDVSADLARLMVQFGCRHLIMWGVEAQQQGGGDGTH